MLRPRKPEKPQIGYRPKTVRSVIVSNGSPSLPNDVGRIAQNISEREGEREREREREK